MMMMMMMRIRILDGVSDRFPDSEWRVLRNVHANVFQVVTKSDRLFVEASCCCCCWLLIHGVRERR
jgi:hypothetical protein